MREPAARLSRGAVTADSACLCRDLAQNWNIDVASELEDYMEELEDIKI
eukprot:COSAG03_NODE_21274_length_306_cov_1.086957_1_plen_48_part_10